VNVFAPGKLVLTGAYAVLEGAPSIVVATTRGAFADGSRLVLTATPEVHAALGDGPAPHVDASSLFLGARKLGLGASAAILVASLAVREAERGADLSSRAVRDALFTRAREAHARAQHGGSGVDVAASVYGGVLEYVPGRAERAALPPGVVLSILACGTSARTSELRAYVDGLAESAPAVHRMHMGALVTVAHDAANAARTGDARLFIDAVQRTAEGLARLGAAAHVPIVPAGFEALADAAAAEGAAFCVSGAGGGDVAAFLGPARPSHAFLTRARQLGLFPLDVAVDEKGVRVVSQAAAFVAGPVESSSST